MSTFKVIKTKIEVFPHPNAEKLQIGKVGNYQVVVQKGLYQGGEDVVFAPEKSILTGVLEAEYKNYLKGPENNRVGSIRLRDELSCGIIIPPHLVKEQCGKDISELPYDEDISEILGITKYIPPIPREMEGEAVPIEFDLNSIKHDVEQFGVYASNFAEGERIVITEKCHGCCDENVVIVTEDGEKTIKEICDSKYFGKVLTYNIDTQKEEFQNIEGHLVQKNINNWYEIETEEGTTLKLTGEHLVYLPKYNVYRRVDELYEDDFVLLKSS